MANAMAICTSFKTELLKGVHALGTSVTRATTAADTIAGALYLASASLGAGTTAYGGGLFLSSASATPPASIDLTATGYIDWLTWVSTVDRRKKTGGSIITQQAGAYGISTAIGSTPNLSSSWTTSDELNDTVGPNTE